MFLSALERLEEEVGEDGVEDGVEDVVALDYSDED